MELGRTEGIHQDDKEMENPQLCLDEIGLGRSRLPATATPATPSRYHVDVVSADRPVTCRMRSTAPRCSSGVRSKGPATTRPLAPRDSEHQKSVIDT